MWLRGRVFKEEIGGAGASGLREPHVVSAAGAWILNPRGVQRKFTREENVVPLGRGAVS